MSPVRREFVPARRALDSRELYRRDAASEQFRAESREASNEWRASLKLLRDPGA